MKEESSLSREKRSGTKGLGFSISSRMKRRVRSIVSIALVVAMVCAVIPYWPEGLFMDKVQAATESSEWTTANSTLYAAADSTAPVTQTSTGSEFKLTNASDKSITIQSESTGQLKVRSEQGDFQVNNGTVLTIPVVTGAKKCTISLAAYSDVNTSVQVSGTGVVSSTITPDTAGTSWSVYTIDCVLNGATEVTLTMTANNYFRSIAVSSSTSEYETKGTLNNMDAEWTYEATNVLKDTADATVSQVQGKAGTYTNADGDILYVDATTGKFAPSVANTRIQVNTGTKMYIPVKGDKATIKLTVNKNTCSDADTFFDTCMSIEGHSILSAKCTEIKANASDSNYKDVTIVAYLDGSDADVLLTSIYTSSNYVKSISVACEELDKLTMAGTVNSAAQIPDGTEVVITNVTGNGAQYKAAITDGSYTVEIPVEEAGNDFTVAISDQEYQITSGNDSYTLSKTDIKAGEAVDVTNNLTIAKLSTYELSGSITGFDSTYNIDNLDLEFTPSGASTFVPEVTVDKINGTYVAKLEKDAEYSVSLLGVNDYEITSKSTQISNSEDSAMNITVAKKAAYSVNLTLPTELDVTGKEVTYKYTNTADEYVYSFSNAADIKLRDGEYTLSLEGDFEAMPYSVKSGADVTVQGGAVNQAIAVEEVKEWSFAGSGSSRFYTKTIQGATGYYYGLKIDATTGKLAPNGNAASSNSAQFTAGAKISIPVTGKCTVSVTAYQAGYALYTIGGEAASTTEATSTYKYTSSEAGMVDIVATGSAYLGSISVVYDAKEVDFHEQEAMPSLMTYGTADSLVVQPTGQRLIMTQTAGSLGTTAGAVNSSVSYYGFEQTDKAYKLTADVVVESSGASNSNGVFFGAFNNKAIATVGIRNKTGLRGIYSKSSSDMAGAGGVNTSIAEKQMVTFTVEKKADAFVVTATPKGEETQTMEFKYDKSCVLFAENGINTPVSYGFIVSGATVRVNNMKYYDETGKLLYDQNACYDPAGTAPVVKSVTGTGSESREYITVN